MVEEAPDGFPPRTLTMMRALCALTLLRPGDEGQKSLVSCLDALFAAYWVEGRQTSDQYILTEEFTRVLGAEDTGKSELRLSPESVISWLMTSGCSSRDGGEGGEGTPGQEYGPGAC
jgi:hypothetical protein